MAKFVTVYDAEGHARTVRAVDAKEIVAAGGSYDALLPVEKSSKEPTATDGSEGPTTQGTASSGAGFPETFPGLAVFERENIGYHQALRMTRDELIAVDGIGEATADKILIFRSTIK